jgi:antitoxin (DNA-binding transcriptional repressor) of toxin-antitoxin stability system
MAGVVHISEEEAARDIVALLERAREGETIRVERSGRPGVMIVLDEPVNARSVRAIIEGLRQREEVQGLAIPDDDFAADVAEARKRYNASRDHSAWD